MTGPKRGLVFLAPVGTQPPAMAAFAPVGHVTEDGVAEPAAEPDEWVMPGSWPVTSGPVELWVPAAVRRTMLGLRLRQRHRLTHAELVAAVRAAYGRRRMRRGRR